MGRSFRTNIHDGNTRFDASERFINNLCKKEREIRGEPLRDNRLRPVTNPSPTVAVFVAGMASGIALVGVSWLGSFILRKRIR